MTENILNTMKNINFQDLSSGFLSSIGLFADKIPDKGFTADINIFAKNFLNLFTHPAFIIPETDYELYIRFNLGISNIISVSDVKSTDSYIYNLMNGNIKAFKILPKNTLVKILALYSIRNDISLDYRCLFFSDARLSSIWYWEYFALPDYITKTNYANIQNHLDAFDLISKRLSIPEKLSNPYFYSTYIHPGKDKKIKEKINQLVQDKYSWVNINNISGTLSDGIKPKIAVISQNLHAQHSVARCTYEYLSELSNDYELTLIHIGKIKAPVDIKIFKNIIYLNFINNENELFQLNDNKFQAVIFPDIGMNDQSIILANIRIAPVQISLMGHSASTFGAKIDYYISGTETEVIEDAEENYSERLVLVPGIGVHPSLKNYSYIKKQKVEEPFIISCPWTIQKINYPHLIHLREILLRADKKILFRFFPSVMFEYYLNQITSEIGSILGPENIEIVPNLPSAKFEEYFQKGDLVIDSFHYGGYTTIIDALFLKKPMVVLEGNKLYNSFGNVFFRKLGLDELIAKDSTEYITKIVSLINDDSYYQKITDKIENMENEVKKQIFDNGEPLYFKKAIDYLLENHQKLKSENSRKPIIIER